ncbi:TPA: site-specific integrase [Bacillus cereus]|nr:site-specific integrase [Bacillus cereus]HDR4721588.1 site-specific integrase [Bacillus cereus]HDR4925462.1 site-specific integrase [Bacillus cereus]HDR5005347.1 site-specific integrase [Bacillus cereus]HEC4817598.1 site-specific integrase [Bacillus cereus]
MDYKFVSKETTVNEMIRGKMRNIKVITIGVLEESTGIVYPHPITEFIKRQYEFYGKSLNSSDAPARVVCRFLNFCLQKIEEGHEEFVDIKDKGINGLERKHGSQYLTHCSLEGLQKATVEYYEKYLSVFYVFLKKMNWIEEDFPLEGKKNSSGDTVYRSVFREPSLGTRFPSRDTSKRRIAKLKDFGEDRKQLTTHFIRTAMNIAEEIALGLCLQFYGGLRRGEVVNVSRGDLIVSEGESMEVQIKDNRKKFFSRLKDTKSENPKRLNYLQTDMCRQTILDNDLVWEVYQKHQKRLDYMIKSGKCKNLSALFLDGDGEAMSGKIYDRRFQKVKRAFLDSLMGHKDYELLSGTFWSTHIGRGVFTNMLIDMGFTPTQLAIARGDRNLSSAMAYIDQTLTTEQIQEAVNAFKKYPTEKLGVIDYDHVKKWKKSL